MRHAPPLVALVIAVALMTACGGGSDGDANGGQGTDPPDATGSGQVGTEEFGMNDEQLVTAIEQVEAGIASCMADAGFEYVPIDPVAFREAMDTLTQPAGLSDEDFVAQYGYGISTMPPTQEFGAGPENAAILNDLSAADQVAYTRTLLGDDTATTFVIALENEDMESIGGCTQEAVESVLTPEQLSPTFKNPFDVLVAQDPRMIAAQEDWAACMSEAGYDFATPDDAEEEIFDRLDTITGGEDPATLTGSDAEALAELQADERAVAAQDSGCQEEFLTEVEEQVERDVSGR